jgi:NTP pyrophosphatase (non-canonical NTP hydrolase)
VIFLLVDNLGLNSFLKQNVLIDIFMTIREAQSKVDEWIKMYGVRYFGELTNMTLLTEEVGELARVMARTYGEQSSKESDLSKNMSEEIGDILWVLICIANQTGVNLEESFLSSIEKKTKRDATRHLNNDKLKS